MIRLPDYEGDKDWEADEARHGEAKHQDLLASTRILHLNTEEDGFILGRIYTLRFKDDFMVFMVQE